MKRLLLILILLLSVQTAVAQDGEVSDDDVNEIASEIYCPVCESTPLDVCATKACSDWRETIRLKLGEGESKEAIFEYFARQFGDDVLADPPRRGASLVVLWVLPVVLLLAGLLFFTRYLRGLNTGEVPQMATVGEPIAPAPASGTQASSDPDEYFNRIEQELKED